MKVKTLLLLFCRKASRFSNLLNENNNETKFISSAKLSRCYNESFGLEFHIFNFFSSIKRFDFQCFDFVSMLFTILRLS